MKHASIFLHAARAALSPARALAGTAAAGLVIFAGTAGQPVAAQSASHKLHCHEIGSGPPEPIGDREGHAIAVAEFTCRHEGGPSDGATSTGRDIWEWDKGSATLLVGSGVTRGAASKEAWRSTEGRLSLTTGSDGKVNGWTASGKGTKLLGTGTAGANAGRSYSWSAVPTGPGRFSVDVKLD